MSLLELDKHIELILLNTAGEPSKLSSIRYSMNQLYQYWLVFGRGEQLRVTKHIKAKANTVSLIIAILNYFPLS